VQRFAQGLGAASATDGEDMKEGIHPNYREVCFQDMSNGFKFVTRSCANTKEMIKMEDGRELPLYKLDTTSESHPFYTGTQKSVDNMGGRVERFRNRFGKGKTVEATPAAAE
jgi:large subunit ribosomal protein L31